jgi:molecular chaperone HtpG
MQEGQKGIYFITGQNATQLRNSPLLEIYKKKDIEVVILADEIDEFIFSRIEKYQDVELKSVNKASSGDDLKDETAEEKREALTPLLEKLKKVLGEKVKDVRQSARLADSPSCIVSDEEEPSLQMRQMLRAMGQKEMPEGKPILEINPDHEIVKKLLAASDDSLVDDAAFLLLDQGLLVEGIALEDPGAFVQRLNRVLTRAV